MSGLYFTRYTLGCPWKIDSNYLVTSKLGCNLLRGFTTYLYRGYTLFTKYHGHPSIYSVNHQGVYFIASLAKSNDFWFTWPPRDGESSKGILVNPQGGCLFHTMFASFLSRHFCLWPESLKNDDLSLGFLISNFKVLNLFNQQNEDRKRTPQDVPWLGGLKETQEFKGFNKKRPDTFHYTDCLIGILIMVQSPHVTG